MKKAIIASAVAAALLTPTVGAMPAFAAPPVPGQSDEVSGVDAQSLLAELERIIASLRDEQANSSESGHGKEIAELLGTALELRPAIEAAIAGTPPPMDLSTIAARVAVTKEITQTIHVARTELRTKVQAAHTELGYAITKAVLRVGNPSSTHSQLEASLTELRDDLARVRGYRDLTPQDTATVYVRSELSKEIWQTRIKRDRNILGKAPSAAYFELNRAITKAVGVQLNPTSTVAAVDTEIDALHAAYDKAAATVTT